ncbi:MAG: hypothetical protein KBB83_04335, partial [Alphaproteobacteria bacterium]|nr:hypothetical protein [Alphaproteobacteria bacterium]
MGNGVVLDASFLLDGNTLYLKNSFQQISSESLSYGRLSYQSHHFSHIESNYEVYRSSVLGYLADIHDVDFHMRKENENKIFHAITKDNDALYGMHSSFTDDNEFSADQVKNKIYYEIPQEDIKSKIQTPYFLEFRHQESSSLSYGFVLNIKLDFSEFNPGDMNKTELNALYEGLFKYSSDIIPSTSYINNNFTYEITPINTQAQEPLVKEQGEQVTHKENIRSDEKEHKDKPDIENVYDDKTIVETEKVDDLKGFKKEDDKSDKPKDDDKKDHDSDKDDDKKEDDKSDKSKDDDKKDHDSDKGDDKKDHDSDKGDDKKEDDKSDKSKDDDKKDHDSDKDDKKEDDKSDKSKDDDKKDHDSDKKDDKKEDDKSDKSKDDDKKDYDSDKDDKKEDDKSDKSKDDDKKDHDSDKKDDKKEDDKSDKSKDDDKKDHDSDKDDKKEDDKSDKSKDDDKKDHDSDKDDKKEDDKSDKSKDDDKKDHDSDKDDKKEDDKSDKSKDDDKKDHDS